MKVSKRVNLVRRYRKIFFVLVVAFLVVSFLYVLSVGMFMSDEAIEIKSKASPTSALATKFADAMVNLSSIQPISKVALVSGGAVVKELNVSQIVYDYGSGIFTVIVEDESTDAYSFDGYRVMNALDEVYFESTFDTKSKGVGKLRISIEIDIEDLGLVYLIIDPLMQRFYEVLKDGGTILDSVPSCSVYNAGSFVKSLDLADKSWTWDASAAYSTFVFADNSADTYDFDEIWIIYDITGKGSFVDTYSVGSHTKGADEYLRVEQGYTFYYG